jgi:hypothetical protein
VQLLPKQDVLLHTYVQFVEQIELLLQLIVLQLVPLLPVQFFIVQFEDPQDGA